MTSATKTQKILANAPDVFDGEDNEALLAEGAPVVVEPSSDCLTAVSFDASDDRAILAAPTWRG